MRRKKPTRAELKQLERGFQQEYTCEGVIHLRCRIRNHAGSVGKAQELAQQQMERFKEEVARMLPHECWIEYGLVVFPASPVQPN